MRNVHRVQIADGVEDLEDNIFHVVLREGSACANLVEELLAFARLHDELKMLRCEEDVMTLNNIASNGVSDDDNSENMKRGAAWQWPGDTKIGSEMRREEW